jgi:predicted transcriptional regulator
MSRGSTVSFRVPDDIAAQLDALSDTTDRPRSWHLEQALKAYLEVQAWQVAHIRQGLDEIAAGKGVAHDAVRDWVASWATEDERDPPA